MNCEVCGREVEWAIKVNLEGATVEACSRCARFGKKVPTFSKKPLSSFPLKKRPMYREVSADKDIVDDYYKRIRKARESRGLTQEDLGKKINEKTSVINRLEAKQMDPDQKLIKKLEKTLGISLLEEARNKKIEGSISFSDGLTLGDMIKKR